MKLNLEALLKCPQVLYKIYELATGEEMEESNKSHISIDTTGPLCYIEIPIIVNTFVMLAIRVYDNGFVCEANCTSTKWSPKNPLEISLELFKFNRAYPTNEREGLVDRTIDEFVGSGSPADDLASYILPYVPDTALKEYLKSFED